MKTIGFIDYCIDQWHAHNYPGMIRSSPQFGGEFEVSLAWARTDLPGKMTLNEWCVRNNVRKAESIQQVVESCDCLVVLAPDFPETHEELADPALRSGKPTYIDKPIATSRASAHRLLDLANAHRTPIMSCSALRYAPRLVDFLSSADAPRTTALIRGGGAFEIYAIHQVEMLVMLLGHGATRVRRHRKPPCDTMLVEFSDERFGAITLLPGLPFEYSVRTGEQTVSSGALADFFPKFIDAMLQFFNEGKSLIPEADTLEIAAIVEAGMSALGDQWVSVPKR